MSPENAQDIYHRIGERLRLAREQDGLSIAEVSERTKLTARTLQNLETGEGDNFSSPIFARGQLRSYARLLGVDIVPEFQQLVALETPPPVLQPHESIPMRSRYGSKIGQYALYLLVTAVIAVPIVSELNLFKSSTQQPRPLDGPIATQEAQQATDAAPPALAATGMPAAATPAVSQPEDSRSAIAASMTGNVGANIAFQFNSESWVKFYAADGSVIEQGLIPSGTTRQFTPAQLSRARIGAAEQVLMTVNGKPVDLAGFSKGSVANFTIGADGMPVHLGTR